MGRTFQSAAIAALAAWAVALPAALHAGQREDKATAEQIAAVLRDSGRMQSYSVGVKYNQGTVWLTGRVSSDEQMQTALEVVSDIEGIQQIVNGMTVAPAGKTAGASARRVSATTADMAGGQPKVDENVNQAGLHTMHARNAARHAPPAMGFTGGPGTVAPAAYDQPHMPNYSWPSYAAYPNYAALTYPKQYSPTAFPFIGPFYPYPQVPLGWRKVSLEWDDGWWFLDFYDRGRH